MEVRRRSGGKVPDKKDTLWGSWSNREILAPTVKALTPPPLSWLDTSVDGSDWGHSIDSMAFGC